ncbi:MAG: AraC family transcriptional regulator [Treponema sp.]|jgi:AraC-like DNA-binding protein|nr:AraC family transcriptional regulator [Treponema sp.]
MSQLPLGFARSDVFAVKNIAVRPGVHIMVSSGVFPRSQKRRTEVFAPVFELSYSRKGDIQGEVNKRLVELKPGHASLGFINRASGRSEYQAGLDIKLYSLWVLPGAFDTFCRAVRSTGAFAFASFRQGDYRPLRFKTDAQEERVLSAVDGCLEDGADRLNGLFLESQVLELLSLNLERLFGAERPGEGSAGLSRTDTEALLEAREILLRRIESPPSLAELSHLIRINDCKLKRSFKAYFGKTVYEYVREQRLERAFSLLAAGQYNVGQSAFAVGYTNISHFSQAFREKFGVGPKTVARRRGGTGR